MKAKNFNLTEEQFILSTAYLNTLRNIYINEMENTKSKEIKYYYQKEIDKINYLFDDFNTKFKTSL